MKRTLFVLLLTVQTCFVSLVTGQSTLWRYAYLQRTGTGPFQLALVDPLQANNAPQFLPLNLTNITTLPYSSIPSPDGQWILFHLSTTSLSSVMLFNVNTGEVREITQMPLLGKDLFFSGPAQDAVWSPNSQYVALNVRNPAPGDDASTDIFTYSLSSNTLTRLTTDNLRDYRIAWSPDSTRIVTTIQECFSIETSCIYRIEVFNITDTSPIISVDISDIVNTHGSRNSTCLLNWSHDGRYLSFFAGCQESGSPTARSEIWLLDTTTSGIQQVTNYTADYSLNPTGAILAFYDTAWYDAQTLLVSIAVTRDNNISNNRTAILTYNTTNQTTTLLSTLAADFLTVNPISQEIAYRAIPNFDAQFVPQTPSVQISIFNGSALSTAVNTTGACKLAWQPNGEILASVRYEGTQCRDTVEVLTFVNRANASILDHIPQPNGGSTNTFVIPIGWVVF